MVPQASKTLLALFIVIGIIVGMGIGSQAFPKTVTTTMTLTETRTNTVTNTVVLTETKTNTVTLTTTLPPTTVTTVSSVTTTVLLERTSTVRLTETKTETKELTYTSTITSTALQILTTTLPTTVTVTSPTTTTVWLERTVTLPPTTATVTSVVSTISGTYSMGERFRIEDFDVAVLSITTAQYIYEGYSYYGAKSGMKLVIVRVVAWNMGNAAKSLPLFSIYLITSKRNVYKPAYPLFDLVLISEPTPEVKASAVEYKLLDIITQIPPGSSTTGDVLFQISSDEKPAILYISYFGSIYIIPVT